MNENDFTTNTKPKEERCFSKHFRYLLNCTIFLTGLIALLGVGYIISVFIDKPQSDSEWRLFIFNILFLCYVVIFIAEKSRKHRNYFQKDLSFSYILLASFR